MNQIIGAITLSTLGMVALLCLGLQENPSGKKQDHLPILLGMMGYFLIMVCWEFQPSIVWTLTIVAMCFTIYGIVRSIMSQEFNMMRLGVWMVNTTLFIMLCIR